MWKTAGACLSQIAKYIDFQSVRIDEVKFKWNQVFLERSLLGEYSVYCHMVHGMVCTM